MFILTSVKSILNFFKNAIVLLVYISYIPYSIFKYLFKLLKILCRYFPDFYIPVTIIITFNFFIVQVWSYSSNYRKNKQL